MSLPQLNAVIGQLSSAAAAGFVARVSAVADQAPALGVQVISSRRLQSQVLTQA